MLPHRTATFLFVLYLRPLNIIQKRLDMENPSSVDWCTLFNLQDRDIRITCDLMGGSEFSVSECKILKIWRIVSGDDGESPKFVTSSVKKASKRQSVNLASLPLPAQCHARTNTQLQMDKRSEVKVSCSSDLLKVRVLVHVHCHQYIPMQIQIQTK